MRGVALNPLFGHILDALSPLMIWYIASKVKVLQGEQFLSALAGHGTTLTCIYSGSLPQIRVIFRKIATAVRCWNFLIGSASYIVVERTVHDLVTRVQVQRFGKR